MLRLRDGTCQGGVGSCNMPSMRKRSLWVRAPLLLLTLLQFSVPAAVAWADARVGEGSAGPAHIESHSTDGCVRVHPSDCAFHRFLTAPFAQHAAIVWRIRAGQGVTWTPFGTSRRGATSHLDLPDSRAPPTLS